MSGDRFTEVVIRIPETTRDQLRDRARTEERQQAQIVRRALNHYFENTDTDGRWLCGQHTDREPCMAVRMQPGDGPVLCQRWKNHEPPHRIYLYQRQGSPAVHEWTDNTTTEGQGTDGTQGCS